MLISKLTIDQIDAVIEILRQDSLRYSDGNYPEKNWISHFITDERCIAIGLTQEGILSAVLIAEKLSFGGCMMWYIAVSPALQGKGLGTKLLHYFETHAKDFGVEWVFLNATSASLDFYKKHGYVTSGFSKVYEHYKDLS
jgi:N-acetylglutamate synthase-like GNAT family acetyltransferase